MSTHRTLLLFITAVLLGGCGLLPNGGSNSPISESTHIYETVSAQLTASALPTPLPSPSTSTPPPNPTSSKDATALPPNSTPPCDRAAAGRPSIDISVPDGSPMTPGQNFTKTWRLVNAGSCAWTQDYAVVWFSGETFGGVRSQNLNSQVLPGQSVDVTLDLLSPIAPGIYQSNWMMRNASGQLFGLGPTNSAPFWVKIEVVIVRTSTPTPPATPSPTATVQAVSRGSATLGLDKPFDLDAGKLASDGNADLVMKSSGADSLSFTPLNGAKLDSVGNLPPSISACKGSALKAEPILLLADMTGMHLCYRTNQSLPGYLVINSVNLKDRTVTIDFLTWAAP